MTEELISGTISIVQAKEDIEFVISLYLDKVKKLKQEKSDLDIDWNTLGVLRVFQLYGPSGVGKSSIVKSIAKNLAKEYGRYFVDVTERAIYDIETREKIKKFRDAGELLAYIRSLDEKEKEEYFAFYVTQLTSEEPVRLTGMPDIFGRMESAIKKALGAFSMSLTYIVAPFYKKFGAKSEDIRKKMAEESPLHKSKEKQLEGVMRMLYPPEFLIFKEVKGIMFFDEITLETDISKLANLQRLLLNGEFGQVKLRDDIIFFVAGNLPKHSNSARTPPLPLVARGLVFNIRLPTIDEWANFMNEEYGDNWFKHLYTFFKTYEKLSGGKKVFAETQKEVKEREMKILTPRQASALAVMLYDTEKKLEERGVKDLRKKVAKLVSHAGEVMPEDMLASFYAYLKSWFIVEHIFQNPELFRGGVIYTEEGERKISYGERYFTVTEFVNRLERGELNGNPKALKLFNIIKEYPEFYSAFRRVFRNKDALKEFIASFEGTEYEEEAEEVGSGIISIYADGKIKRVGKKKKRENLLTN